MRGIHPWPWSVCTSWRDNPRLQHWLRRLSVQEQSQGQQVSRLLRVGLWPWEHDHPCGMFWNLSQVARREDGNTSQPCGCDDDLFHRVPAPVRALIRSQGGPMAGMALSTSPTSETWTSSCQTPTMAEDWRSWLTVCLYSEDATWPSTQPLLEPSMPMGQLGWERQTGMEWHSWRRDDAKKPPIQS